MDAKSFIPAWYSGPGIYVLYWAKGGSCLASVGYEEGIGIWYASPESLSKGEANKLINVAVSDGRIVAHAGEPVVEIREDLRAMALFVQAVATGMLELQMADDGVEWPTEREVLVYLAGVEGRVPASWDKYAVQYAKWNDPEYREYLRLKARYDP